MLDLVPIREGHSVAQSIQISLASAQHAESIGFERYWLAEHHNMKSVASSSTAVLVGHIAGGTKTIRVGSGGIMLPNHTPLVVAEAFGTLAELYPNRIDLGLGRAPGTDRLTMQALRRERVETEQDFPAELEQLQRLLGPIQEHQSVVAMPGAGTNVPIWLLGSSLFSAQLAAAKGLPYAFASHFAPGLLLQAIELYRRQYRPSVQCPQPYVAIGVPCIAAQSDEQAQFLAGSIYERILGILTGKRKRLQPPQANFLSQQHPQARAAIEDFLAASAIGSPDTIRERFTQLAQATQANEFILVSDVFDSALKFESMSIAAQVIQSAKALQPSKQHANLKIETAIT
jgi:luciferase family oxidoreductase group 1